MTWQERLEWMRLMAAAYPHTPGQPVAMHRRGKRGRGRLRSPMVLAMRVAASAAVGEGEQALVDRDGRRRLAPHQVYAMRVRALRLERDEALAAEYGVSQSSATRAIAGDTYRDVPFPIRITHPNVPGEIFYPYETAITILAAAPIEQHFTVTIQPHTPTLRISGFLRLMDRMFPAQPSAPRPRPTSRPTHPSAPPTAPPVSGGEAPMKSSTPQTVTPDPDSAARDAWTRRRRRFG